MKGGVQPRRQHERERDIGNWIFTIFVIFGVLWVVGMVSSGFVHFKPSLAASVEAVSASAFDDPDARYDFDLYLGPHTTQHNEGHHNPQTPHW